MKSTWGHKILEEIDELGVGLTQWEVNFVESIMRQLDNGTTLSQRQERQLDWIHDNRVA